MSFAKIVYASVLLQATPRGVCESLGRRHLAAREPQELENSRCPDSPLSLSRPLRTFLFSVYATYIYIAFYTHDLPLGSFHLLTSCGQRSLLLPRNQGESEVL